MALKSRRDEYAAATREAILQEAARLFATNGYSDTSLAQITESARVTKGALYHHFDSKTELYAACFEKQAERVAEIIDSVELTDDPWRDALEQCRAFLNIATTRGLRTMPIQEAITVLGWKRWRTLDKSHTQKNLMRSIERMNNEGLIKPVEKELLADAIFGILVNAMMSLSTVKNKRKAKEDQLYLVEQLLSGILKSKK